MRAEDTYKSIVLFYKYFIPKNDVISSSLHDNHTQNDSPNNTKNEVDPSIFTITHEMLHEIKIFLETLCKKYVMKGRILLATEGINGTLSAYSKSSMKEFIHEMESYHVILESYDASAENLMTNTKWNIFKGIDWKLSFVNNHDEKCDNFDDNNEDKFRMNQNNAIIEPFPDLKIAIVKEIVSTGCQDLISLQDVACYGGKHLSPEEFHSELEKGWKHCNNDNQHDIDSSMEEGVKHKDIVVIDVRNTYEYDIGHFLLPSEDDPINNSKVAVNPETIMFSSFDTFCENNAETLKDKKVLMYCTGGIRCEKASVMLRKRGVEDVSQLSGGIHRYLEVFGANGYFKGKNFVFDQRVAMDPLEESGTDHCQDGSDNLHHEKKFIVGKCVECCCSFDELKGSRICTVCKDLVLVCPNCQDRLREYHCRKHSSLKHSYFTYLEVFDADELSIQQKELQRIHSKLLETQSSRNKRKTILKQIRKVQNQICLLKNGEVKVEKDAPKRCRTCHQSSTICDGLCWGFWKQKDIDTCSDS